MGHRSGSRVSVPSGNTTTHSPSASARRAASSERPAVAVPRDTGICSVAVSTRPSTGTFHSESFAMIRGTAPPSHTKWQKVSGSMLLAWLPAAMNPPGWRRCSAPDQVRRVVAIRNARTTRARLR